MTPAERAVGRLWAHERQSAHAVDLAFGLAPVLADLRAWERWYAGEPVTDAAMRAVERAVRAERAA